MIRESNIIDFVFFIVQMDIVVFEHIGYAQFSQHITAERIIHQYVRVFIQTSGNRQSGPPQRPMAKGCIQQDRKPFLPKSKTESQIQ